MEMDSVPNAHVCLALAREKFGREVDLTKVKAHTGIIGNERVDMLAKQAANGTNE